jgi:diguanylate cyclase (GGDEF)-like protein
MIMAELQDLTPLTKNLSLLYIDENQKFLTTITTVLRKVFKNVDDASDAILGLDYLKVNQYDLVIIDSSSEIMSASKLIENIRKYNRSQQIILTTQTTSKDELLSLYSLNTFSLQVKPFKISDFLKTIQDAVVTLADTREYLRKDIIKLEEEISSQKRRIGRFMMNEKALNVQIDTFKDSAHINKNIYELTKLPSRYALQEALNSEEQSIIYINIDHFEFVNTTYGMGKANKLLQETANKLKKFLPLNATLYHITADEYVILLNQPSQNQVLLLAEQIQALFKESAVAFDGHTQYIVFSIGIDSGIGKKLFINAKAASKEARHYSGNQIVIYDPQSVYMRDQRDSLYWVGILQKAFDEDRIFTYYQPIISNETQGTKHYEVLCRLMDNNNKLVDANKFIHSAKQVGLITQITKSVIDKAFKLFSSNEYNFSINISMHDLHENYLLKLLDYKCKRYNVSPKRVYLEIVEDIIISKSESIDKQIVDLKHNGFHVIVDDFGTDKSAYNRMFELEAEYIKINGTFIKELSRDKAHQLIVKSIVDFAKKSGIKTIAEHVESQEIYDIVKELGVDYSQGYYLGKPALNLV